MFSYEIYCMYTFHQTSEGADSEVRRRTVPCLRYWHVSTGRLRYVLHLIISNLIESEHVLLPFIRVFFSCVKKITKIGKCATFFFASVIFCDWKKFLMANNTRYYFCILNVFCEVRVHAKKAKITWYMVCFWYEYLQLFKQSSQQAHHHMKWSYFIFLYSVPVHVHEIDSRLYKFWIWW